MGIDAQLSCTATGFAWLSTLPEDDAVALVSRQGMGKAERYGPNAPASISAVMKAVRQTRSQGYAIARETYVRGLSALSAPIVRAGKGAVGVLSISGPSVRLTDTRMHELVPDLLLAAADIAGASSASPLFDRAYSQAQVADVKSPVRAKQRDR